MTAIAPPPVVLGSARSPEPEVQRENAEAVTSLKRSRAVRTSKNVGALLGFAAASALVGAVSGMVNRKPRNKLWYRTLAKPSFTPPDRVFALVWPLLYGGAAVSAYRVWKTAPSRDRTKALALWGAQLGFNGAWSPIFFGAHRPKLAMANLAGNAASLAAYANTAAKVDRPAAALVVPYLGWLGFAALMNAGIVRKNSWRFASR